MFLIIVKFIFYSWIVCGIIGYVLRLIKKQTRPVNWFLCLLVIVPHIIFGYISLFYGYVCYSQTKAIKG
ncbi:hypothetical protein LCGC14_1468210 [marine sediment metagenome]|uniref:Uncharacterized protein n=1 Tax=marine sediment metagenome TaxID=412755 RepID=A0A0F9LTI9_9ZZZZ